MRKQVVRRHFLERRGEGVGIILNESKELSEKPPIYELFDEELRLTIFAAHNSSLLFKMNKVPLQKPMTPI